MSISGYHIREAGSTAVQELAFTLADGFGYVRGGVERGLDVDDFAPRLSFFFDVHNDFFEEIAKLRAARRIWATLMRDRFGAKKPESMRLRTHAQTAGCPLTAQQPLNNVVRVALQALAAVLGGAQSLHTNSIDETLALPTEEAVTVALRTQQIIAEETGVAHTVDPLGGCYSLEPLTDQMEAAGAGLHPQIDAHGRHRARHRARLPAEGDRGRGLPLPAHGRPRREGDGRRQQVRDARREARGLPAHRRRDRAGADRAGGARQGLARRGAVEQRLQQLAAACREGRNVMPVLVDAVKDYVSLGEISDVYRRVFGLYREPIIF